MRQWSRVELFEQIRRDRRADPSVSVRELARSHGVHRRTVRQAIASAVPPPRQAYPARARPAIDPWREVIDGWLIGDQEVPRKQRHTARRVWQRLVAEHDAQVAEVTVSRYVATRRVELGLVDREVFVPQVHAPGAEAEVDFGEFETVIAGTSVKVWMFVMRLSHSGRAFHVAYGTQAQEAFLQGHVEAFAHFGGVPARVRYDNLKPAVTRVLKGRDRTESDRFIALRSHYGFDSFFCIPGKAGAHEKGGVEGEIGRFRRRHLVPTPTVASLAELNQHIAAGDVADDARVITGHHATVGVEFAAEQATLLPLPSERFDPGVLEARRVDHRSRVSIRQNHYSVPARYVGRRLVVRFTATTVTVFDGPKVVAVHERATGRHVEVLSLDHYLEVLTRKPGALPGATALAQAKAAGAFTPAHQRYWDAARRALGDGRGTRALVEVLLAHRTLPAAALTEAIDAAVIAGILAPEAVIIDARARAATAAAPPVPVGDALARYDRPAPSLTGYDDLLTTRRA
ncbi:MAG: IS21 family transposase [Tetrasphaera sp.]|nr:IS21 family transposase [Tetrasphaera sp.]